MHGVYENTIFDKDVFATKWFFSLCPDHDPYRNNNIHVKSIKSTCISICMREQRPGKWNRAI